MYHSEILKKVRQIEIKTKKHVDNLMAGSYRSVFKGLGMEFDEVKEYSYGDDIKNIDWNVTARSDNVFVKSYVEERELVVIIAIDASGSQDFGTADMSKKDLTLQVSALLAFSALKNKDKVGLLIFSDKIELFIPPKKSKNHVLRIIREIATERETSKGTNLNHTLIYLNRVLKRKAIVFFISDFFTEESFIKAMKVSARKNDFVAVQIEDPIEKDFKSAGLIELVDSETGEILMINSSDSNFLMNYKKFYRVREQERERIFKSLKVDYINLSTDKPYIIPLVKFFNQRSKRR